MTVVGDPRTACLFLAIALLTASAGTGDEPSPPRRQPIELLRAEIEARKAELAQIRKQRAEAKATSDREIADLKAENAALKKEREDAEKEISELETAARDKSALLKAALGTLSKFINELTLQTAEMRAIIEHAFPPKPGDKPPAVSTDPVAPPPETEPGVEPFDRPHKQSALSRIRG